MRWNRIVGVLSVAWAGSNIVLYGWDVPSDVPV